MRWEGHRESSNIEDRRDGGDDGGFSGSMGGGGSFRGLPVNLGGGGIGTIVIVLLISWALGINPMTLLGGTPIGPGAPRFERETRATPTRTAQRNDQLSRFVAVVLADTEDRWATILPQQAKELAPNAGALRYQQPRLVLFSGSTRSACGLADAATGPFYCPADRKVYIDLAFYDQLKSRFKAPGDFAQAYVISHEIGHHIQNLLGILPEFNRRRQSMSERDANRMSVRVELQADCLAGVWAHYANGERDFIEAGDIEEALNAASRIGDDSIQRTIQGYVVPDAFTHGSSEQRVRWFKTGFQSGQMSTCDTFAARTP
jgi:uncharacterized protein